MSVIRWIVALGLGGLLLFFGVAKFTGAAHIFPYIAYKSASFGMPFADLAYPLGNNVTGGLEVIAGLALIIPLTRAIGARLAVLPFLGAVAAHLSPILGLNTPDGFADPKPVDALATGGPFSRADFSDGESSTLFVIACAGLLVAIINIELQTRGR